MPEPIVRIWFDDGAHFLDVLESHALAYLLVPQVSLLEWLWPRCDALTPEELL